MVPTSPASPEFDPAQLLAHRDFVRALARRLVFGDEAAEELAQQTIATAWAARPEPRDGLRGWLAKVALRLRDRRRRDDERRMRRERGAATPEAQPSAAELAAQIELEQRLAHAVARLHEPYRATLFLRYWHDLAPSAIAVRDEVSVATVKSRLQRALAQLRAAMDAAHGGQRDAWAAALLKLAPFGAPVGAVAMGTSAKVATAAAIVIAAMATWRISVEPGSGPREAESAALELAEPNDSVAATAANDGVPEIEEIDPSRALAAERSLASLPFASGVVVDPEGRPIEGVRIVPLFLDRSDPSNLRAVPFFFDEIDERAISRSDHDGAFAVAEMPHDAVTLALAKEGREVVEWNGFSRDREQNQGHRFTLPSARDLPGRVHDTEGRAIEKAFVSWSIPIDTSGALIAKHLDDAPSFRAARSESQRSACTDAEGRFRVPALPKVHAALYVSAQGYATRSGWEDESAPDFDFELRRNSVLFDVRDSATGARLDDAVGLAVDATRGTLLDFLQPLDPTPLQDHLRRMRVAGRLTLYVGSASPLDRFAEWMTADPPKHRVIVHVDAPGHIAQEFELTLDRDHEPPAPRVALEAGDDEATLAGRVTGAASARIEVRPILSSQRNGERSIDIARDPPLAVTLSHDEGHFEFGALPSGRYRLDASTSGFAPITMRIDVPATDIVLPFVASSSVVVVLRDRAGSPLAGVDVHAELVDQTRAWDGRTDANGTFEFDSLPGGTYFVAAFPDGLKRGSNSDPRVASPIGRNWFIASERVALAVGERFRCELSLPAPTAVLFRIVDQDGLPVADATLKIETRGGLTFRAGPFEMERVSDMRPRSDAMGETRLDLLAGDYGVTAELGEVKSQRDIKLVSSSEATITLVLPRFEEFGAVEGRVTDLESGTPLSGRLVAVAFELDDESVSEVSKGITDDDGRFRFDRVPAGRLRVLAWGNSGASGDIDQNSPWRNSSSHVTVATDSVSTVDLPIARVEATKHVVELVPLSVTIHDETTGAPIEGASLSVGGDIGAAHLYLGSASSKRDGIATLLVPQCERYTVKIRGPRVPRPLGDPTHEDVRLELDPMKESLTLEVRLKPLQ